MEQAPVLRLAHFEEAGLVRPVLKATPPLFTSRPEVQRRALAAVHSGGAWLAVPSLCGDVISDKPSPAISAQHTGPAPVSNYFYPAPTELQVDGAPVLEAAFRGRLLRGIAYPLPDGLTGAQRLASAAQLTRRRRGCARKGAARRRVARHKRLFELHGLEPRHHAGQRRPRGSAAAVAAPEQNAGGARAG